MISQEMLELLQSRDARTDEVVFYCGEVFEYIELKEKTFETNQSTINFNDADDEEFKFYTAEYVDIEDNIIEFIKQYKQSLKSIQKFESFPKTLLLFIQSEYFMTTEEALEDILSFENLEAYGASLELVKLTYNKNPTKED